MAFTVGELAKLTGITVRALHHYDDIGLVRPSQRTAAGYRLYTDDDVARLQQVLLLRELGLPLEAIAHALDHTVSHDELLRQHRAVLAREHDRLGALVAAVDAALATLAKGQPMQPDDVTKMFDAFDHTQYEGEARTRWGHTEAYAESARRTRQYGPAEWDQIKADSAAIYRDLAALMTAGVPAADPQVQALVEQHRAHIDRWFYPCSIEMHKALGAMYVADARFTENLDKTGPGFARYLADAIAAS